MREHSYWRKVILGLIAKKAVADKWNILMPHS